MVVSALVGGLVVFAAALPGPPRVVVNTRVVLMLSVPGCYGAISLQNLPYLARVREVLESISVRNLQNALNPVTDLCYNILGLMLRALYLFAYANIIIA
eukprot:547079-Amorphochlora_amoeboformis.AAC.1